MNYRKLAATIVAVVVAGGLTLGGASAAFAGNGQETCSTGEGWTKVDLTEDDIFEIDVTADEGKLIAETCVKAAKDVVYDEIDPAEKTVTIVAPGKHAISHYSYRQVDEPVVVPEKPEPVVTSVPSDSVDCEARVVTTTTTTTTTDWVLVDNVWVPGTPVVTTSATTREATEVECPIDETPTPRACVPAGDWYTEGDDVAPSLSPDGLVFTGGSGDAVGIRVPVTGNLQGWTELSYEATGDTGVFYVRIVVDSSADGGHSYSSLTVTSGSPVTASSVAYSNKLGVSKTLAEWAEFYPNAVITSVGFHLDSAASADDEVVLSSATGPCATVDFTSEQPADIVTTVTEDVTDCEAGTVTTTTTTTTTSFVWVEGEWVEGEPVITTEDTTRDATEEECPVVVTPPTETPTPVVPAATTPTSALAETGFDMSGVYLYAALSTIVLGAALAGLSAVALKRRKAVK